MKSNALKKLLLRVAVTATALYLTFSAVPLSDVLPILRQTNISYLVIAFICLHLAQVISALRTRFYLTRHSIELPRTASINLQYVGGLFSAFLPGGAGGDAYKAWWLKRYRQGGLKDLIYLMIANRLNGLWSLGIITCLLMLFSPQVSAILPLARLLIIATIFAGTIAYNFLALAFLKEPLAHQYRAGLYSFPLQILLLGSAYAVYQALGFEGEAMNYMIIFMLSCVVAMLPLSIGGIGLREFTLLHVGPLLGLSAEKGVAFAFGFTLLNLTIPMIGALVYSAWKPKPAAA